MAKITIEINDIKKEKAFIDFLKEIPFITIENNAKRKKNPPVDFCKLYGIWKGRNIDPRTLRKNAWDKLQ